jgi:hypothetical protein
MTLLPALLLAAAASAETGGLPAFPGAALEALKERPAPIAVSAALAETPEERARHAASLTWPGGPNSTYRSVIDTARRRAGDPARDIVSDRWPGGRSGVIGHVWYLEHGAEKAPLFIEDNVRSPWSDSSAVVSQLAGRPAIVSAEYIAFRSGATALVAPAVYGQVGALPPFEAGRSAARPWLQLVQFPSDSRGDDCVSLNRVGRHVSGCGDVWQDGIDPANELACYQGQTWLRCHLWCVQQTTGRAIAFANGPCP